MSAHRSFTPEPFEIDPTDGFTLKRQVRRWQAVTAIASESQARLAGSNFCPTAPAGCVRAAPPAGNGPIQTLCACRRPAPTPRAMLRKHQMD